MKNNILKFPVKRGKKEREKKGKLHVISRKLVPQKCDPLQL